MIDFAHTVLCRLFPRQVFYGPTDKVNDQDDEYYLSGNVADSITLLMIALYRIITP